MSDEYPVDLFAPDDPTDLDDLRKWKETLRNSVERRRRTATIQAHRIMEDARVIVRCIDPKARAVILPDFFQAGNLYILAPADEYQQYGRIRLTTFERVDDIDGPPLDDGNGWQVCFIDGCLEEFRPGEWLTPFAEEANRCRDEVEIRETKREVRRLIRESQRIDPVQSGPYSDTLPF